MEEISKSDHMPDKTDMVSQATPRWWPSGSQAGEATGGKARPRAQGPGLDPGGSSHCPRGVGQVA